jgi:hypothetical protein
MKFEEKVKHIKDNPFVMNKGISLLFNRKKGLCRKCQLKIVRAVHKQKKNNKDEWIQSGSEGAAEALQNLCPKCDKKVKEQWPSQSPQ